MVKVRRYWRGRAFCYSEIIGKDIYLTGYIWYYEKAKHDSRLHELVDFIVRDILKEVIGRTTGEVLVDEEVVRKHLSEIKEYVEKVKGKSWRTSVILNFLAENSGQSTYSQRMETS
jgi:hypothetical protein